MQALFVDEHAVASGAVDLTFDRHFTTVVLTNVRANVCRVDALTHQRIVLDAAKTGECREVTHRFSKRCFSLCVLSDHGRDARVQFEDCVFVDTEVDELDPINVHQTRCGMSKYKYESSPTPRMTAGLFGSVDSMLTSSPTVASTPSSK